MRFGEEPDTSAAGTMIDIASLVLDGSPRLEGEDVGHTHSLAGVDVELPPILVHRGSMRVIDGMHRVRAALLRGQDQISVWFFDGDADAAFVRAVEANVAHGLPLSLADRRAAAGRIVASYPEWSDREVARLAGLSAKAVRAIRESTTAASPQSNGRLGRDGRVRPLDAADGRVRAAAVLSTHPDASVRQVAKRAGVSVGTASDVRKRLRNGENPLPAGMARRGGGPRPPAPSGNGQARGERARPGRYLHGTGGSNGAPSHLLQGLRQDPSLKYSDQGRQLLRWLDAHVVEAADWSRMISTIPPHCRYTIADIAVGCAEAWHRLATELRAQLAESPPQR